MAPRTSVPILLLTGFLGSGKTSLLRRWLAEPEFSGAMVIVNELGEVGLDDRLVETASEAPLLLDNGCACCAAGEDLAATLQRLFLDRLHRVIPAFDWVLIETTGVAQPRPILDLIARHELVAERYHVRGVVTCLDARRGPLLLATEPECLTQVQAASTLVITRTDLVDPADAVFACDAAARARPDTPVLLSGRVPPHSGPSLSAADLLAALAAAPQEPGSPTDHRRPGPHDHASHLADVTTAFVPLGPLPRAALDTATKLVLQEFGGNLLRMKGIVQLVEEALPQVVQAEHGLPLEATPLTPRAGAAPPLGLTLIARRAPAAEMAAALQSCLRAATYARREGRQPHV